MFTKRWPSLLCHGMGLALEIMLYYHKQAHGHQRLPIITASNIVNANKMLSTSFIALGLLLLAAYRWFRRTIHNRTFAAKHGCEPPPKLRQFEDIIGVENVTEVAKAWNSSTWLDMWFRRFTTIGTTFQASSLGRTTIFTVDPQNIKAILATQFKEFDLGPRRMRLLGPIIGPGIFTNDGHRWEHSRSLVRPTFTKVQVSDLSSFEGHVQDLLTAMPQPHWHTGRVDVNLQPLFFRLTLDSATELLLGRSFRTLLASPDSTHVKFMEAFDYAQGRVHINGLREQPFIRPFAWLQSLLKGKKKTRFEEACETVHTIMDEIITGFLAGAEKKSAIGEDPSTNEKKKYVFLDELAKEIRDPMQLRYETLNVLLAGRDTTAALLSNTFFVLARRPDIWAKLRAEVDDTFGGAVPDYEQLRNVKYVRNVLNESLRLYPVVPFNSRMATKDTTLPTGGGPDGRSPVHVRAGQLVNYHVWSMHRMPAYFGPDAGEFNPDRWNDSSFRPGWACIPFNGGARICVGQQYALTNAAYVVVRLVQEFESIDCINPDEKWVENVALVTSSRSGAHVSLTPRSKPAAASQ
ncbi:cytochrome P450 [Xylariaceae sp. FL0016]|nr:cytochrome P450 [Xylariaceae sp. FL0016]